MSLPVQPLGCSRARDIFGTPAEKTTCSFSYRFRGNPGIWALNQARGIVFQEGGGEGPGVCTGNLGGGGGGRGRRGPIYRENEPLFF